MWLGFQFEVTASEIGHVGTLLMGKLNFFFLIAEIILFVLMENWIDLILIKKSLLRCWEIILFEIGFRF